MSAEKSVINNKELTGKYMNLWHGQHNVGNMCYYDE